MKYKEIVARKRFELANNGFVHFQPTELDFTALELIEWERLCRYAKQLPPDPTSPTTRFRAYGKSILANDTLTPVKATLKDGREVMEYTQPAELNSEQQGRRRFFTALPSMISSNFAIRQLVQLFGDIANLEADNEAAWQVGMHLVKLVATPSTPAAASPNHFHRDGEPYTFAVLVERDSVVGGENAIAETKWAEHKLREVPSTEILSKFTLENSLEAYGVNDVMVSHHVEAIACAPNVEIGHRTVLLIDFTPLRPVLAIRAAA
jgi:hypothetical protein